MLLLLLILLMLDRFSCVLCARSSVIAILMQNFAAMGLIFVLWFLIFGLRMSWKKVARGLRVDWCGASVAFPDRDLVKVFFMIL